MKKTETLKKNYEFKNVLVKGKSYFGKHICIYVINSKYSINEIGIAVGKKIGNAVKRNKIKRWIREAYNLFEDNFNNNYKIVFVVKKDVDIEKLDFWKIKNDIEELLKKAGTI